MKFHDVNLKEHAPIRIGSRVMYYDMYKSERLTGEGKMEREESEKVSQGNQANERKPKH